jgi:hypothetical protein
MSIEKESMQPGQQYLKNASMLKYRRNVVQFNSSNEQVRIRNKFLPQ